MGLKSVGDHGGMGSAAGGAVRACFGRLRSPPGRKPVFPFDDKRPAPPRF